MLPRHHLVQQHTKAARRRAVSVFQCNASGNSWQGQVYNALPSRSARSLAGNLPPDVCLCAAVAAAIEQLRSCVRQRAPPFHLAEVRVLQHLGQPHVGDLGSPLPASQGAISQQEVEDYSPGRRCIRVNVRQGSCDACSSASAAATSVEEAEHGDVGLGVWQQALGRRFAPREEHVAGLDVKVNHSLFVQISQGLSNVQRNASGTAAHQDITTQFQGFFWCGAFCAAGPALVSDCAIKLP